MGDPTTLAERIEFLRDITRLQLWFARQWLATHADEDFRTVLRKRIDIYRRTDLHSGGPLDQIDFDSGPWTELEQRACDLYDRTRDDDDASRLETEGVAIFADRLEAYARRRFAAGWFARIRKMFSHGALRYDPPPPAAPRRVILHIANTLSPKSIFDDPAYLPRCFSELMGRAREQFAADSLGTGTWLNSEPRWLAILGPQWTANLAPPMTEVSCGMGWWGQFLNAKGVLNHKRALQFRQTGVFPFYPRESWCTFDALERHLATLPNPHP